MSFLIFSYLLTLSITIQVVKIKGTFPTNNNKNKVPREILQLFLGAFHHNNLGENPSDNTCHTHSRTVYGGLSLSHNTNTKNSRAIQNFPSRGLVNLPIIHIIITTNMPCKIPSILRALQSHFFNKHQSKSPNTHLINQSNHSVTTTLLVARNPIIFPQNPYIRAIMPTKISGSEFRD